MLTAAARRAAEIFLRTESAPAPEAEPKYRLSHAVLDHYRCPQGFLDWGLNGFLSFDQGYFQFGHNVICYGRSCGKTRERSPRGPLNERLADVVVQNGRVLLPFDPSEIIDNLRLERYISSRNQGTRSFLRKTYYYFRPYMSLWMRGMLQRFRARNWGEEVFPKWPVDTTVEDVCERLLLLSMEAQNVREVPFIWFWPDGASGCVTMTHDVEAEPGRAFCAELMDLNDSFGIKSSFQIVPEVRYQVSSAYLESIRSRGFEVAVHDLNHDGRLYDDREEFLRRAEKINHYASAWQAKGFRAGALYRNPEWFADLNLSYDMSMPNVGHLDPQAGGCCTVMPYLIGGKLEIPLTTVQDYMLFYILKESSIDLWKKQIATILGKNGLVSFIVHPDYVIEGRNRSMYVELLEHLRKVRSQTSIWFALPCEIDEWWRCRSQMRIERVGNSWRITGRGSERATLAFAKVGQGSTLFYELGVS
jgi:hypothetical protein